MTTNPHNERPPQNDMVTYPPRPNGLTAIHLCSGYGGFELALRPWGVRTVCHVERDSYAAAILMERMGQQRLDMAPIWDDLTTFDGEPWRGKVDIVTAGFPCQPFSNAGARRGLDDDRWLWPAIARIVTQIRPRFVILENVPPVIRAGLPAVLADLANNGFDAEWGLYSAAEVGAPHRRQRWWCVAYSNGVRREHPGEHLGRFKGTAVAAREPERDAAHIVGVVSKRSDVADPAGIRRGQNWFNDTGNGETAGSSGASGNVDGCSGVVADPASTRREGGTRQDKQQAITGFERHGGASMDTNNGTNVTWPGFPPTRDNTDGWQQWINKSGPQPVVRRNADGPATGLVDALHLGGNGLVPQCATEAIRQLLNRAGWQLT